MSGGFGWHRNDTVKESIRLPDDPFRRAVRAYEPPAASKPAASVRARVIDPTPPPTRKLPSAAAVGMPVPGAGGSMRSTASNVMIVVMDVTGSMHAWPGEIFKRLPLLYHEACAYLDSDDLEILFIAHADAAGDEYPLQVARFGRGPELDPMLGAFRIGGGGTERDGCESHELVLYKLVRDVDTSSAVNVHAFFITDEAGRDALNETQVRAVFGRPVEGETRATKDLARQLLRRMNLWAVLCETGSYSPGPILAWWESLIGNDRIVPLNDHRRVVDVLLATLAKHTGQIDRFTTNMRSRQAGSRYAGQNVKTVMDSVAAVGTRGPLAPKAIAGLGTRPLLPAKKND
ncbi:hypothetical protein A2348_02080 [Candidatus Uhrbacteria bacterium RIFOXYB12_FULL_58_10]|uniref:VWFA domain-containing protein n=1 Tax=Candidatus Uhrbacteria bacterium RIFOXYB2_FULL_57_15 TaxID=1802422 RepID=A0A1F7W6X8_9BACT|nr:MAG: hypothetical protein A2348_02080 [Candidatus Uhrbacteria bacterium RIFOXYB12_FULL_58_10]OGL98553.1 MAG: hypothetical protein A2304_04260 [Candidatus Uhrbacteria bacterium RIFOXYB2_FULL_57_15]